MIINGETLRAASRGFRAFFYDTLFAAPEARILELFYPIQTSSPEEVITIVKGIPKMREWVGDRIVKSLSAKKLKIAKKDYEATLAVEVDDLKFDRFNQIRPQIANLGLSFLRHYRDHAIDLLKGGQTGTAWDNQNFFDTDHAVGRGGVTAYKNLFTGPFSENVWVSAVEEVAKLSDTDSDEYLGVFWSHVFYGNLAFADVQNVFAKERKTGGETNIYFDNIPAANRVLLRELGSSREVFLFDLTNPSAKPLMLMVVNGVNFVAIDRPTDPNVFNQRTLVYGIDSTDNADYMYWETAAKVTAS